MNLMDSGAGECAEKYNCKTAATTLALDVSIHQQELPVK